MADLAAYLEQNPLPKQITPEESASFTRASEAYYSSNEFTYPKYLLPFLMPTLQKQCPPGCPSPNNPGKPLESTTNKQVREALLQILENSVRIHSVDFPNHLPRYNEMLESLVLAALQGLPTGLKTDDPTSGDHLCEEGRKRRIAAMFRPPLPDDVSTALRQLLVPVFGHSLNAIAGTWNASTDDKQPCLHTFEATWNQHDLLKVFTDQPTADAVHQLKLTAQEERLPPIDSLLEKVQNLVATRAIRGKPWNRPRECRTALRQLVLDFNRSLLELIHGIMTGTFQFVSRFFEVIDGPTYLINTIRMDHRLIGGGYNPRKGRTRTYGGNPAVQEQLGLIVSWFFGNEKWHKFVAGQGPPPPLPTLPPSSSANASPTHRHPISSRRDTGASSCLPGSRTASPAPPTAPSSSSAARNGSSRTTSPAPTPASSTFKNPGPEPKKQKKAPTKPQYDSDSDDMPPLEPVSKPSSSTPASKKQASKPQDSDSDDMPPLESVSKPTPTPVTASKKKAASKPQPQPDSDSDEMPPLESVSKPSASSSKSTSNFTPPPNNVNGKAKLPNSNGPTPTMTGAAATAKLKALQKDRTRLEKEIAMMEKSVEQLRGKRRATDKDLFRGEYADHIAGFPSATPFPVGMPADPSETSPHSSPYFLDLPHYNPVKVCPPHLHRSGSVFNNTALDPLDYTLTSLFSSALLLEVFEKEGPLVLESVRNAALTYLFNKVDKNWDSSSSSSQAMIKKTLNAVLSEKALWKQAVDQPVGSNAVPGALINARLQIQQLINAESPRMNPFKDGGSPCICELTNHLPAIDLLSRRFGRAAAAQAIESNIKVAGSINNSLITSKMKDRLRVLGGPNWSGDKLEKNIDSTLKAFETEWEVALSRVRPSLKELWEPTEELFKWIGGVRLWEESKRIMVGSSEDRHKMRLRSQAFSGVTRLAVSAEQSGRAKLTTTSLSVPKMKADDLMKNQDYASAAYTYDLIALASPNHVAARTNAALARIREGGVEEAHLAISDSTAALAYAPRSVKALYRRSTALQTVGRADLAKIDLELALSYEPTHKEVKAELERLRANPRV